MVGAYKKKRGLKNNSTDEWLLTYADIITLLMTFFVLMLSMSNVDTEKFAQVYEGIAKNLLKKDPLIGEAKGPFNEIMWRVNDIISKYELPLALSVVKKKNGLVIELSSNSFFVEGSAEIPEEIKPLLAEVAFAIRELNDMNYIVIEIEGHSDNLPIHTKKFQSNWELSALRATSVLRFLVKQGIDKNKLKASAYAETRPKIPYSDQSIDMPIDEVRNINRRVNIYIHPHS